jgi:hypothetical protein
MLHSLIYHSGVVQWVHLWPNNQGTQSHPAARIKNYLTERGQVWTEFIWLGIKSIADFC